MTRITRTATKCQRAASILFAPRARINQNDGICTSSFALPTTGWLGLTLPGALAFRLHPGPELRHMPRRAPRAPDRLCTPSGQARRGWDVGREVGVFNLKIDHVEDSDSQHAAP